MKFCFVELAHLVELYVEALNSPGGIPVIGSTWQRVLEATYTKGMEEALQIYREIMTTIIQKLPMENDQLLKRHRNAVTKAMEKFNKAVSLDSESELYQSFLEKLMVGMYSRNAVVKKQIILSLIYNRLRL